MRKFNKYRVNHPDLEFDRLKELIKEKIIFFSNEINEIYINSIH
jgi:hypothetical protein